MLSSQIDPCPACGKSRKDWLVWAEAFEAHGHARAQCLTCLLTDIARPRDHSEERRSAVEVPKAQERAEG